MTIQPIASTDPLSSAPNAARTKPAPKTPEPLPKDTVQLSPQAQAAADLDHDGDSR